MRYALAGSLLLHGMLLLIAFYNIASHDNHAVSVTGQHSIRAYLQLAVQQHDLNSKHPQKLTQTLKVRAQSHDNMLANAIASKAPAVTKQKAVMAAYSQATATHDQLLSLLHQRIQQHLIVAEELAEFANDSSATIGFYLLPNGATDALQLQKSTGIAALDQAVINAVTAITPVTEARRLLSQKSYFTLTVRFVGR